MDLSNFLFMRHEISLIAVFLILLAYDLIAPDNGKKYFQITACVLFGIHTILGFFMPKEAVSAFGGMYITGDIYILVKNILNIGVLLAFMQANTWLVKADTITRRGEYFVITLFTLLGMYYMISAGNFLMFYIGLELSSIPLAILVAYDKFSAKSAEAGAKYILSAAFSSAIMLYGISLVYGVAGTTYFDDIQTTLFHNPMAILGMVFFLAGLFFKLSMVPFHLWTADVYEGAPTVVTAYLSTVTKTAVAFVTTAVLFKVFMTFATEWQNILWWIIIITITIGNLFAIRQQNLKRFFAFSSISQVGYIALGILAGTEAGMTAVIYYSLIYIFSNFAIFGVIQSIESKTGKIGMNDYDGLYSTNPKLALIMMIALFSLGGIPPFAGFFSKFFIFTAAAAQGQYLIVLIALINTIISLYYYLLIVKAMFINKSETPIEALKTDSYGRVALIICTLGIILIGLYSPIYQFIGTFSFGM